MILSKPRATEFKSLDLPSHLIEVVEELGFKNMTPIQAESIPALLKGSDLIGQSKTGSGKTAAFTLPILKNIDLEYRKTQALVLCPTRELCTQVAREIRKLGRKSPGLQVLILSGGMPMGPQFGALDHGVHIVVGTPGRVIDHLKRRSLDLRETSTLVLDEADRMLDMGFQEDIETILSHTSARRQTVFFSATFPREIEFLSEQYQNRPVFVKIEETEVAVPKIRQTAYETAQDQKEKALVWLLQQHKPESAIIFCNMKATVANLADTLDQSGISVESLHGDLEQRDRDRVMAKFRNQSTRFLIATDVAARGIDIADLEMVINYDLPQKTDTYVHRIGRTGRAGKTGIALSMITPRERNKIREIENTLDIKIDIKKTADESQLDAEFSKQNVQSEAKMSTLFISGGRKEKMRPGDILGALTGEAGGFKGSEIGKIEIHDHFSYVAVSKTIAKRALETLQNGRIKGRRFRIEEVR